MSMTMRWMAVMLGLVAGLAAGTGTGAAHDAPPA